jgi:hypothetical protein
LVGEEGNLADADGRFLKAGEKPMDRSISRFCLLSLWGLAILGPGMQAELGAVELDARQEAGSPWEVELKVLQPTATIGQPWKGPQAFGQDDPLYRGWSVLPEPGSADKPSHRAWAFYVPLEAGYAAQSLFGRLPPEPLFRPIPTYWSADVFMPIPTTWDAEIILAEDVLGAGYPP